MQAIELEEQLWTDVEACLESDDRILLPVGSTEQHGVFAPLGTDTYVAKAYVSATRKGLQEVFDRTGDTITGRPSQATPEKGKAYHEHLVR